MERLQGVEGVRPTAFSTSYTYNKMKRIVNEFVSNAVVKDGRVLDVGCNRGYDLLRLSEKFAPLNLRLYGIDVVPEDLFVARSRFTSLPSTQTSEFMLSIVEKMPFNDGVFDAVICSEVVEHLPNPDKALKEIARVLRTGGVMALTTPNPGNKLHKLRKFLPSGMKAKTDEWRQMQLKIDSERKSAIGVNLPHISELNTDDWCRRCNTVGLDVLAVKRGSLLYGDPFLEDRPGLWAMTVLLDRFLDRVTNDWSWQVLIKARKR